MSATLTVYTTPTCTPCKVIIGRLERENIPHTVVDLTQDEEAYQYVTQTLGRTQTPVIVYQPEDPSHTDDPFGYEVHDAASFITLLPRLTAA